MLDKELHFLSRQVKSDWKMHLDFCNKLKIVTRLDFNTFIDACTQNICIAIFDLTQFIILS